MRKLGSYWKEIGIAVVFVVLNGFFLVQVVGIHSSTFSWKAFAQVYGPQPGADADGDGVPDSVDPRPNDYDPSGCFYDVNTGQIIPGGTVTPSQPGAVITTLPAPQAGCFQFQTDRPGTITLSFQVPQGCTLDLSCPDLGIINPNPLADVGNPVDALNPGFLTAPGCTPWYTTIQLDINDVGVIDNNIPLICGQPAPALSPVGWLAALGLLAGLAFFALRRRRWSD